MGFLDKKELEPWAKEMALVLKVRAELFKMSSKCMWCSIQLTEEKATLEHIVPRSHGGKTEVANCGIACSPCNKRRGTMTPEEFRNSAYMKKKMFWVAATSRNSRKRRGSLKPQG